MHKRTPSAAYDDKLRVLQLTDLHLYADPSRRLVGHNTQRTLELVLDLARKVFWPVDRVLLTGDLVHDESPEGDLVLERQMSQLGTPCNCLPGNHDSSRVMARALNGGAISTVFSVVTGAWNLILLDSTIPGEDGGHLDHAQLARLEQALASHANTHALVCLHHQPVPVGSAWMDTMALDNPEDFFAVIDRYPWVRGVLWGHIHQAFYDQRRGVDLFGSPSTCIQFLPGSDDFALDTLTPGFRWLELHPDGCIRTGIERIACYPDSTDLAAGGY